VTIQLVSQNMLQLLCSRTNYALLLYVRAGVDSVRQPVAIESHVKRPHDDSYGHIVRIQICPPMVGILSTHIAT
jgi:hypothetical protein